MKTMNNTFDVIISGGGLSGSLMALSLSTLRKPDGNLLSIGIIEEKSTQKTTSTSSNSSSTALLFDDRVLALSHGSAAYLSDIGVWSHIQTQASAIEKIDISDRKHYGKARLTASQQGVSALGFVIGMTHIGAGIYNALSNKKNIEWFNPDTINDIQWQHDKEHSKVGVTLSSGKLLKSSLLLACDGVNSVCRKFAGIKVSKKEYQQVALITNVATQHPHQHKAFERFTEFGPIAMLPLTPLNGESRCSLVWTMEPEQGKEVLALDDVAFKKQLEQAFGGWLGAITQVGKRDLYPLVLLQAQQQTYHRLALVGNASHTIHPIAGQGFNLGLRDVKLLASLINNQLQQGHEDIGSFALLQQYERQRKTDQQQIIQFTDSLVTLFSNELPPLIAGRNIGLKVMNYCSPLKNTVVKKLMGY